MLLLLFFIFNVAVLACMIWFYFFTTMHFVHDALNFLLPPPHKRYTNRRDEMLRKKLLSHGGTLQILLWAIFVFFCIPRKSPFVRTKAKRGTIPDPSGWPVPFLNGQSYFNTLESFKKAEIQGNVLVVYGPKSHSKSRGIKEKCWEWEHRDDGRGDLCIFIDLKSWNGSVSDYAHLVGSTIVESLQRTNFPVSNAIQSQIEHHFRPVVQNVVAQLVRLPLIRNIIAMYVSDEYVNLAHALYQMVAEPHVDDFEFVYSILDQMANEAYPRKLIFIVSEVQQLAKIGDRGMQIWRKLYSDFGKKKMGDAKAVHIVETSESFLIIGEEIRQNTASFRAFQVQPLKHDDTKEEVVNQYQFLNESDFDKAWSILGGYAGGWFEVLQSAVDGLDVNTALEDIILFYNKLLMDAITEQRDKEDSKMAILQNLKENDFVLRPKVLDAAATDLVKQNVLFWDGRTLKPQNGLYEYVIRENLN